MRLQMEPGKLLTKEVGVHPDFNDTVRKLTIRTACAIMSTVFPSEYHNASPPEPNEARGIGDRKGVCQHNQ
jgi:hypothetical protein